MSVRFGTKAETLERLKRKMKSARILPQVRLTLGEWRRNPERVMATVSRANWANNGVIVRSSAKAEDRAGGSLAGAFLSVQNVRGEAAMRGAIEEVIASYGSRGRASDQVFLQPQLGDVVMGGVAFSVDPNTGSPYLIVNYDDRTGSTSSVTSGRSSDSKVYYLYRRCCTSAPGPLKKVAAMMDELERFFGTEKLDAEFAITRGGKLHLLQVRPLALNAAALSDPVPLTGSLARIETRIRELSRPHPYLFGRRSVFGVMPDWNPAEMIGTRPRPLALSLYRELVTDNIWAYQRDNYGYRNLRSFPLMVSFGGLPYIDVRISFNSFIPKTVTPRLAEKLANYYIDRLLKHPGEHDKVEFEIVYTCYTLDLPQRLGRLRAAGFSAAECGEISRCLRGLTNTIINPESGLWKQELERIRELEGRIDGIGKAKLDEAARIYWLLEDCKRYGTLPFSGLARAGFIAVQLLKSLVNAGVFSPAEYDSFMGSLDTVSSRMTRDFHALRGAKFLKRYGHLRPGTYDVLSPRYDEAPDRYFDWSGTGSRPRHAPSAFALSSEKRRLAARLLKRHGIAHDVKSFFDFIRIAIEGREYAKFVFTRSLSDALSLFKKLARRHGLSVDDVSYAEIDVIRNLYASSADRGAIIKESVARGRKAHALTRRITLPPLIVDPRDAWGFHMPESEPNYITLKSVTAPVATHDADPKTFKGKVLFIPSADPGFDWVFSHGIAGLVTAYGGANSHMAIRSGELGIPGVIGAGEVLYRRWAAAGLLEVDCGNRRVRILK